ncbi:MAG: exopolysaccharide biosynthesis polyprenyl glycosylphosphotransferase [Clostridiaceae bacterium]|nr:exopolysaccharide biosynthesis polyprenyl glycosylphosphotransferase [Clostridiaceae bacterium]
MRKFSIKDFRRALVAGIKLAIIIVSVVIMAFIQSLFYSETMFVLRGNILVYFIYMLLLISCTTIFDALRIGYQRTRELALSYLLSVLMANILMYFIFSLLASRMLPFWPILVCSGVQWLICVLLFFVGHKVYIVTRPSRACLAIVGKQRWEHEAVVKLTRERHRYDLHKVISAETSYDELCKEMDQYRVIIIGLVDTDLRAKIIDYCFVQQKRLLILPNMGDIILNSARPFLSSDSLFYTCRNQPLSLEQLLVKRLMDIVISFILLAVTLPITLIVALLIYLYDRGPVFFYQKRYTRNGEIFTLIKFRSMRVDAEKDGAQLTVPNDSRITPIGRFIRRTRIDELPQLINVLKSEMSLVGPRAERVENTDYYAELMPEFLYRHRVKAGLTGYAQLYGRYNTTYEDKARLDLLYIENYSLRLDLSLLLSTVKVLFRGDSTEGFDTALIDNLCSNGDCDDDVFRAEANRPVEEE